MPSISSDLAAAYWMSRRLLRQLAGDGGRDFGVMTELHGVGRASLSLAPQVRRVAEHLRQRHERTDDLRPVTLRDPARLHPLDVTAPAVQVADDVAHELLGHD